MMRGLFCDLYEWAFYPVSARAYKVATTGKEFLSNLV